MSNSNPAPTTAQTDAVLRAASVLLRVVARSVVEVEDLVTTPQLRVLVMIASHGPQNVGAVAAELGVHPSNATRTCDRLVQADLILRREDPNDRRYVQLDLTKDGSALVARVLGHRRRAVAEVMAQMTPGQREETAAAMAAFASAAGGGGSDDGRFSLAARD
ncbi:MAG TPA: MarR family transcriptional regulator [Micrococcaceae bacterium]